MARPWFRFYRKTVNNPKAQKLSPELFKAWVNILCATDDDGRLPEINDLAFTLRVGAEVVNEWLLTLRANGFFDLARNGKVAAHDWSEHNYESDVSTGRVKRFRKRFGNAEGNAPDTESDTEQKKSTQRTRLPADMVLSEQWLLDGQKSRNSAKLNPIDLVFEWGEFVAHFTGPDCKEPLKVDWHRAWLRWCRTARGKPNGTGFVGANRRGPSARDKLLETIQREATDVREG